MNPSQRKPIKFDLPIDGENVATGDELRDHFTTEILDHFRTGLLVEWLKARPDLRPALAAVEALVDGEDRRTLLALCNAFGVDADEHAVEAALAVATGAPPRSSTSLADKRTGRGRATRNLASGCEDRWPLDVLAPAFVELQVAASSDVVCSLENESGRQVAADGTIDRKQDASLAAILSRGRYYIRLRAVDENSIASYDLQVSQSREVPTSDLARYGADLPGWEKAALSIKELGAMGAHLEPGRADLFVFNVLTSCVVRIETRGEIDTVGYLLGPDGDVLAENDDSGPEANFAITSPRPLSGEFAILVHGYESSTKGDYQIRVFPEFTSGITALRPLLRPRPSARETAASEAAARHSLKSHGLKIVWDEQYRPNWRS